MKNPRADFMTTNAQLTVLNAEFFKKFRMNLRTMHSLRSWQEKIGFNLDTNLMIKKHIEEYASKLEKRENTVPKNFAIRDSIFVDFKLDEVQEKIELVYGFTEKYSTAPPIKEIFAYIKNKIIMMKDHKIVCFEPNGYWTSLMMQMAKARVFLGDKIGTPGFRQPRDIGLDFFRGPTPIQTEMVFASLDNVRVDEKLSALIVAHNNVPVHNILKKVRRIISGYMFLVFDSPKETWISNRLEKEIPDTCSIVIRTELPSLLVDRKVEFVVLVSQDKNISDHIGPLEEKLMLRDLQL